VLQYPPGRTRTYERTRKRSLANSASWSRKTSLALRTARLPFERTAQAELREGFGRPGASVAGAQNGRRTWRARLQRFCLRPWRARAAAARLRALIEELKPGVKESPDRCYVNNFKTNDRPRLISLPRGQANGFKKDMQAGIDFLRRRIPQVFEGEPFQRQKGRIVERFTAREKDFDGRFHTAHRAGSVRAGAHASRRRGVAEIFPVLEGQMVPIEDISKMVHEGNSIRPSQKRLSGSTNSSARNLRLFTAKR